MMSFRTVLLAIAVLISTSCETDFEVNAEWKDVSVVYGILNQNDSLHYIKINKAYLGEGDALQMATEFDSTNYGNEIEVFLQEMNLGTVTKTFAFTRDSSIAKETGVFSNPFQVLFRTQGALDDTRDYHLVIQNNETNKSISATTPIIDDFNIVKPGSSVNEKVNWTATTAYKPRWFTAEDGKLYQLTIRLNFREVDKVTNDTAYKSIDWVQPAEESLTTKGGEEMQLELLGDNFYMFVASQLQENFNINRLADGLDFIVDVAGEEFNTYMEVNRPSTGIVQEKPEYTNLENAIGLFSCRYQKTVLNKIMTLTSQDSLRDGRFTKHLGFL